MFRMSIVNHVKPQTEKEDALIPLDGRMVNSRQSVAERNLNASRVDGFILH